MSGIGRTNAGGCAFEQCSADLVFECLHLPRKRGLRHPQPNGSAVKTPFLKGNQERPKLCQHEARICAQRITAIPNQYYLYLPRQVVIDPEIFGEIAADRHERFQKPR
jgi:hypothetical protein